MKPITEQRRQELIADLEEVIKVETHSLYGIAARIALASLTAVPFAWIHPNMLDDMDGGRISGRVWNSPVDEMSGEERLPVYTAPPVPVIKLPEYRSVNALQGGRAVHSVGYNDAIDDVKTLNGLGE